jgi:hypothetical protein
MMLSMAVVSMPKQRKSLALLSDKNYYLLVRKKAAGHIRRPVCFRATSFLEHFPAVLTSDSALNKAPVAQWIEHLPSKQRAAGSSPAGGTIFILLRSATPWTA